MSKFFFAVKKRQTKTPAQDRLQNVAAQLKNETAAQVLLRNVNRERSNETSVQNRLKDLDTTRRNEGPASHRSQNFATIRPMALDKIKRTEKSAGRVGLNKSISVRRNTNVTSSANTSYERAIVVDVPQAACTVNSSDDIPSLFPPRTPGQDRLNRFRHSLNPNNDSKPPDNESAQHAMNVIQTEFGLSTSLPHDNNQNATIEEDEPMDWEPCDIFERVENIVYNDIKNPYIIFVPDTNVLLSELSCIRDTIHRGWCTLCRLLAINKSVTFSLFDSSIRCQVQCPGAICCATGIGRIEKSARRFENFGVGFECYKIHFQWTEIENSTTAG